MGYEASVAIMECVEPCPRTCKSKD